MSVARSRTTTFAPRARLPRRRLLGLVVAALGPAVRAQASMPGALAFLLGDWLAEIADNRYSMRVSWDDARSEFRGHLTKNGVASGSVGFRIGEHVWTARVGAGGRVAQLQKHRSGGGGVSTGFEWVPGVVHVERSSPTRLVTSSATFTRVATRPAYRH